MTIKKDYAERSKAQASYIEDFYKQYPDGVVPEFYTKIEFVDGWLRASTLYRGDDGFSEAQNKIAECVAMIVWDGELTPSYNQTGIAKAKRLKFSRIR